MIFEKILNVYAVITKCHLLTYILTNQLENGNYIIGDNYLIKHTFAAFNVIYISVFAQQIEVEE